MKNLKHFVFTIVSAVFSCVFLCSCPGHIDDPIDEEEPSTLSVSVSKLDFTALGGERSFSVTSNTSWAVNGAKSWCYVSITQSNGNKEVLVEVEKNTTKEERSCRLTISTNDGLSQIVNVTQDAAETTLTVSPADITLNGEKGSKDEVTITTNGHWTISNIPDWLNIPSSGDGNTKCKLETLSANETDEDRIAELRISAEGKSAVLKVTQKALRVKCYIEPKNLVALWDEIGFELQPTGDVDEYKYIIHLAEDIDKNRLTDKNIENELSQLNSQKLADYNPIFFPDWYVTTNGYVAEMYDNTQYYICTIAYDSKGNPGVLTKTPIRTLKWVDRDNDAYVTVEGNFYDQYMAFDCTKQAYCDSYHLIYGNLPRGASYNNALFAFEINYYLKNKRKHWFAEQYNLKIETYYPNNHTFIHYWNKSLSEWPVLVIMPWGVYKDGSVSSDLLGIVQDTSNSSSQMRIAQQQSVGKNKKVQKRTNNKKIKDIDIRPFSL